MHLAGTGSDFCPPTGPWSATHWRVDVFCSQLLATMPRTATSRSFSLRPGEVERFDALVERLANGSPTEFVRLAMDRMEALENWRIFENLRSVGLERARARQLTTRAARHRAARKALNPPLK